MCSAIRSVATVWTHQGVIRSVRSSIVRKGYRGAMSKRAPADGSEWSTIVLLMLGAFFVGIGWVVGVVALWRSRVWTVPEKLIGTLLWPGGLVTGMFVAVIAFQGGGALVAVGVVAVVVPLGSAFCSTSAPNSRPVDERQAPDGSSPAPRGRSGWK